MKKSIINKIIKVSENLDWSVQIDNNNFTFSKYSPAGQDFNIEIGTDNLSELIEILKSRCEDFDICYETYLWLDDTGHGANGAPYDMKDLYEDMEACLEMMKELYNELESIEE